MATIETMNLESLANSSMYVSISFERFGNSRKARIALAQTEAVESRFSHSKRLLNSSELVAIVKADNGLKEMVDALCLPSKHEMAGLRMAPNKNILKIAALLKEYKTVTRPELINAFIAAYPTQRQEAVLELKEHFKIADFPPVYDLVDEFSFEYFFVNLGVPQQLVDLSPELAAEEAVKQQETFKDAMNSVADTLLATFSELVNKLNDGLNGKSSVDGKKKSLLPSHFNKLTEFIDGFEAMSSFAPAVLRAEVVKMQQLMLGVDIDKVRHSDNLKADLIAKTGEIASTVIASGQLKGRFFRQPVPKTIQQDTNLQDICQSTGVPVTEVVEVMKTATAALPGENDMLVAMLKSAEKG